MSERRLPMRWPFERRLLALSAALSLPSLLLGGWWVLHLKLQWVERILLCALLALLWLALTLALLQTVTEPLRTLLNVIGAYRAGDYTFRSRGGPPGDVMTELSTEIGMLGHTLHAERLRAMEASALLEQLVHSIDVAIMAIDGEGRLRVLNPAASALLGVSREQALGKTAAELSLDPYLADHVRTVVVSSLLGRHGHWQITHGTFRSDGVTQHLLVVADLRQALRAEERLAWQRLIRVISHEVNNSLAPIKSLAQTLHALLGRQLPPGTQRTPALQATQLIADRADRLGQFLVRYGRLARLPTPQRRWYPVTTLLTRVAALERHRGVQTHAPVDLEVHTDENQLEQALINLVHNAVEVSAPDVRVIVSANRHGEDLAITVTDEGPGIANPDNLFVPFFTTKAGGSGIGLLLSRQIAEAHGGTLTLENRRDARGAVATLEIPAAARQLSSTDALRRS